MRDSVRAAFPDFTRHFEGDVGGIMYLDILGLVTTGYGNLIDPVSLALRLPWAHADGTPATQDQIVSEWTRVKGDPSGARLGWRHFVPSAALHLSEDDVMTLVMAKLDENEKYLRGRFAAWDSWPADAQLATLSIAWAAGPAWKAPNFDAAARSYNWALCAVQGHLDDHANAGLVGRNATNAVCFVNASKALDRETLYFPQVL